METVRKLSHLNTSDLLPPEMTVTGVEIGEYRSGIPLPDWESVQQALYIFASGRSRSSRSTESHNIGAYSAMSALGGDIFLKANNRIGPNTFVDTMLQEAEPEVRRRGRWSRSYDYDGQGSFHKTSVEIIGLQESPNGYLLGLHAAYVGKEVEDGLAEQLKIEQGLQWKSVKVLIQPENGIFRVDFNQLLQKLEDGTKMLVEFDSSKFQEILELIKAFSLNPVANLLSGDGGEREKITWGELLARHFMTTDKYGSEPKPYVLWTIDGLEVTFGFGRVGDRYEYSHGQRSESRWIQTGAVIETPLTTKYDDKSQLESPSLVFSILKAGGNEYHRLPILDALVKTKADILAHKIADAFL